jgi:hypothetical protein
LFTNPQLAFSAISFQNLALSVRNVTNLATFHEEQERKSAKLFMLTIAFLSTSSLNIIIVSPEPRIVQKNWVCTLLKIPVMYSQK